MIYFYIWKLLTVERDVSDDPKSEDQISGRLRKVVVLGKSPDMVTPLLSLSINPLSPKIQIQILQTDLHNLIPRVLSYPRSLAP